MRHLNNHDFMPQAGLVQRALARGAAAGAYSHHAAMVECMDESVGIVLAKIDSLGLKDNTVVFLASDNGGLRPVSKNDPLRGEKGSLTEGGVRIPLLLRWPGRVPAGMKIDTPVSLLDVMPTLMAISGAVAHPIQPMDGDDLLGIRNGTAKWGETRAIFQHFNCYINSWQYVDGLNPFPREFRQTPAATVRRGPWKLMLYFEDMVSAHCMQPMLGGHTCDLQQRQAGSLTILCYVPLTFVVKLCATYRDSTCTMLSPIRAKPRMSPTKR